MSFYHVTYKKKILFSWVLIRNGCEILKCNQLAYPYSDRCLNWNILQRGAQRPLRPRRGTNWWKPTFLCDRGPWETDERRMEGDGELHDSLTAEVVCGNLRNRRWDQLSKQRGFRTTGDSYAWPYYLNNLVHSPFFLFCPPPFAAVSRFLLIRWGNNKEGERKRMRVSEWTEGGRKFNLFGHKVLMAKKGELFKKKKGKKAQHFAINLKLGNGAKHKLAQKQEC